MEYASHYSESSKLRRTRSLAVRYHGEDDDDNSSVSSLGSLPEADYVAQHFEQPKLTRQRTTGPERRNRGGRGGRKGGDSRAPGQHHCPHCTKTFQNSWAVPKHVSVSYTLSTLLLFLSEFM